MEIDRKEQNFPGFAAEASLEGTAGQYAGTARDMDGSPAVAPAAFCWDPWRMMWVIC
jgi:hypothetical protein